MGQNWSASVWLMISSYEQKQIKGFKKCSGKYLNTTVIESVKDLGYNTQRNFVI
jgi:hypothetical protein